MKNSILLFAAALSVLFSSGCATSKLKYTPAEPGRVSSGGEPVSHVVEGMNSGVYLFYYIPLWTGSPRYPNQHSYDLLRHQVDDKAIYRMFETAAMRMRADRFDDVTVTHSSVGVWTLWIVWKRSVHGRGVLIRKKRRRGGK